MKEPGRQVPSFTEQNPARNCQATGLRQTATRETHAGTVEGTSVDPTVPALTELTVS